MLLFTDELEYNYSLRF